MNAATLTLGDLARDVPIATSVFLRHQLDFCCRGHQTLQAACADAGLDVGTIERELDEVPAAAPTNWAARSTAELIDFIETRYHATLRRDVPPLIAAAAKVERVHAAKPAVPLGLAATLEEMWLDLERHMQKEEQILFPMLRAGDRRAHMPIQVMRAEHDVHGTNLGELRALTGGFVAPPHACATWRALYDGLARLQAELMAHIHLENHVLFDRAGG